MTGLLGETQDEFYTISFAPYDYPLVEPFIFNQMIRERIQKIFSSSSARQFVKNMDEVIFNGIDVSPIPVQEIVSGKYKPQTEMSRRTHGAKD